MQRKEIIRELELLYQAIPANKMIIFKEFMLAINLNNISRYYVSEKQIRELFLNLSGTSALYDWNSLRNSIIAYMRNNENKTHTINGRDIVLKTVLRDVLHDFTYRNLLVIYFTKVGVQYKDFTNFSIFLSYHLFTEDNFMFRTCETLNKKLLRFFSRLFNNPPKRDFFIIKPSKLYPSTLSKYYILHSMLPNEEPHNYNTLMALKADLVPEIMTESFFSWQFSQLNKISFTACLKNSGMVK